MGRLGRLINIFSFLIDVGFHLKRDVVYTCRLDISVLYSQKTSVDNVRGLKEKACSLTK